MSHCCWARSVRSRWLAASWGCSSIASAPATTMRPGAGTAGGPRATDRMATAAALLPLAAYGFVLGWSVAWPPGPINAEIVRRGLARGFGSAYALGFGAASGDAVWAVAIVLGAGALVGSADWTLVLELLSTAVLLLLAAVYLRG